MSHAVTRCYVYTGNRTHAHRYCTCVFQCYEIILGTDIRFWVYTSEYNSLTVYTNSFNWSNTLFGYLSTADLDLLVSIAIDDLFATCHIDEKCFILDNEVWRFRFCKCLSTRMFVQLPLKSFVEAYCRF